MIRPGVFSLAILFGTAVFSPASFSQTTSQPVVAEPTPSGMADGCPVSLLAQRKGMPTVVATDGKPPVPAAQLQLHWENRQRKEIVAAAILVQGFDATPRLIPAVLPNAPKPMLKKIFAVKLALSAAGRGTTDLALRNFASIRAIELKSIEYADGGRWNAAPGLCCIIAPSGYLPVDGAVISR
jgi:hypothetical protein